MTPDSLDLDASSIYSTAMKPFAALNYSPIVRLIFYY